MVRKGYEFRNYARTSLIMAEQKKYRIKMSVLRSNMREKNNNSHHRVEKLIEKFCYIFLDSQIMSNFGSTQLVFFLFEQRHKSHI